MSSAELKLRPLGSNFLFQFTDDIRNGRFIEETASGLVHSLSDAKDSTQNPRWVTVRFIGRDVKNFKPGDVVLLPPLRWTDGVKCCGETFWRSNEEEVLAVSIKGDAYA